MCKSKKCNTSLAILQITPNEHKLSFNRLSLLCTPVEECVKIDSARIFSQECMGLRTCVCACVRMCVGKKEKTLLGTGCPAIPNVN